MVQFINMEVKIGELSSCNFWLWFGKYIGKYSLLGILQILDFLNFRGSFIVKFYCIEELVGNFYIG